MTETIEETDTLLSFEISAIFDDHYDVIVYNDDVTTFETVIRALVTILHYTAAAAEKAAWTIHNEGKATVASLPKDEAEEVVKKLHGYKIQAAAVKSGGGL